MGEPLPPEPLLAIVGPTGSGKSALGIAVALACRGEIINCDSVQVYRDLNIGTNKVPSHERHGVPHHLIDVIDPAEHFTAGDFAVRALATVGDVEARGHLPLLVGGTGFYLRALTRPLFTAPPTDLVLRRRIQQIHARHGPWHLHRMLERLDPGSAGMISPEDWSRVARSLEYRLQTGRSFTADRAVPAFSPPPTRTIRYLGVDPPRSMLYERINRRTEQMFDAGWVEEVRALLAAGVPPDAKAFGAHGYRRILQFLAGSMTMEQARERTAQDVRHYAKRQLTWFRRVEGAEWFPGFGDDPGLQRRVITRVQDILQHSIPR
ncbi:MAG: tRNA (adenosine(37)-N6)-dimethylallyltransferase MiaA [Acidobacteria bacterium]|nr:tRNA (adenosine(37)-N6)-dimethylallyltransferase MiaA [Acidobacteriota bacterium]